MISRQISLFVKQTARNIKLCTYKKLTNYSTKNYQNHILLKSSKRTSSMGDIHTKPSSSGENPFSQRKHQEFMSYFPEFVESLTSEEPWSTVPKFKEKLTNVLKSNVDFGTNARGVATVVIYEALEKCQNLSHENIKLAIMLGWCGRMMESSILTLDDIVDNSSTRGGRPCWFRNRNVGLKAITDSLYMENGVYYVLRKYFSSHPQYLALIELFLDISFKTYLGQSLDLVPCDLDDFTIDYYNLLAIGKAEYCVFYGPVVAAMLLANITDEEVHRQVRPLLFSMGNYYQIQNILGWLVVSLSTYVLKVYLNMLEKRSDEQKKFRILNDFLDCYGNPEDTGKTGSDIREGKCSWLAVKALEKANRSQRILMQENYGKNDDTSIRVIQNLYDEMNLTEEYRRCEEQTYRNICSKISKLPENLPHELFYMLLDKVRYGKWGA